MSVRRHILVAVSAVAVSAIAVAGLFGANTAQTVSGTEQQDNAFWIKTKLPEELLAGRLNVTTVAKSPAIEVTAIEFPAVSSQGVEGPVPLPERASRENGRTAQLLR